MKNTGPALLVALLMVLMALPAPAALALDLEVVDDGRTAGYLTLGWDHDGPIELQQRDSNNGWRTVYTGRDTATTFSGLADGRYAWRARALAKDTSSAARPWGAALDLEIVHHPLQRALGFFAAGAVMFLVLLACIAARWRDPDERDSGVAA